MASTLRVFLLQIAAKACWGFLLGPGVGRSWRLRYVGVEIQYVAREAGPWGAQAGSERVPCERVHLLAC